MAASVESSLAHPRKIGHFTSPRPRNLGRVPTGLLFFKLMAAFGGLLGGSSMC